MKKLIMGFAILTSMSAVAGTATGLADCKSLLGKYSCDYQGQNVDLSVSKIAAANSIKVSIAGDAQTFVLDGVSHKSSVDDSQNVAECKEQKEIVIDNFFHNELKASFSVLKTTEGVTYTMIQGSGTISLNCKKK